MGGSMPSIRGTAVAYKQFVYSGKAGTFLSKELAESLRNYGTIPLKEKVPINCACVE